MRRHRLSALMALLMFAICMIAASATSAAPAILLLTKSEKTFEAELEGKEVSKEKTVHTLETLGKEKLTAANATLKFKGCLELNGSATDTNLCHEGLLTLTGVKKGAASCRSENEKGEKDPLETVLIKPDLHIDSEKPTEGGKLPLLVIKMLGINKEAEVTINCAAIKVKVKGRVGCLLSPGLKAVAAGGIFTVECEQSNGDQKTGTCEETPELCKELKEDPLLANFGKVFEDAAIEFNPSLKGSFNTEVFIDD